MKATTGVPAPKDAEYPHVPTPKELELSRQVVDLQQEKDVVEHELMAQIQDLESQIHKLHVRIHDLSQQLQTTKREQVQREQEAVERERGVWKDKVAVLERELDQEKNDKEAQKRWRTKFSELPPPQAHQAEREPVVEPLEDSLAKFAQSIALLPARTAPKATQAGVLPFLVHLLRENFSDVVTGSVLMALVHLAIYHKPKRVSRYSQTIHTARRDAAVNVKEEVVKAGVAAPLAHILETVRNQRVLAEASRLCAALSSFVPNKRVLAAKNVVRFLILLLVPGSFRALPPSSPEKQSNDAGILDTERLDKMPIDAIPDLQRFALSALVNLSHDSEVIRSQIVNFHFIPIAVRYLRESDDVAVQAEAAKLLGNLAYNHVVNQSVILTAEGDAWLTRRLTAESVASSRVLARACAIAVGNLAYTSVSQLSIGYGDALTFLLQILVDSSDPLVLEAAAVAVSGICHQSPLNKGRAVAQNGLQVLLYVISRSHRYADDKDVLMAALECLCILARPKPARSQVMELDGHLPLCHLCKKTKSRPLLIASAMAICVLIPPPLERRLLLTDSKESKLETNGLGLAVLKRVRHLVFGKEGSPAAPLWLEHALDRLASYAATAVGSDGSSSVTSSVAVASEEESTAEFHERSSYSMESLTEIEPDELCPAFYEA